MASSLACPFCSQGFSHEPDARRRTHFKACSTSLRNDVRDRLATEPHRASLSAYYTALAQMSQVLEESKDKKGVYVRILRMWRANELLGRGDYLGQVTDMAELDKETLDVLSPLLSSGIQAVVAIEDTIFPDPRSSNRYTSLPDTPQPLPAVELDILEEDAFKDRLEEWLDNRRPIASFAREFRPHHPLVISGEIV
ncbi:hypothetical protein PRZ48_013973 [Zasmidium cellare]|uniref:Uncharacterized protein n=1 Tax=Zasmidium cellare TaxID=395010 RepID=A0ABR0DZM3_ZASCE|nr:hypothetical protein PRZ48_013973 [Zasmidium cellare]